ncbi:TRAP transporter large permease subunit [Salinibacterium sp. dk2585]|uniref:TRAP transporter large permease n=1 Tax=unclassified Salinibacterium TaxID=2632331 RepID=UPI0011C25305|nr:MULTISPECIES: TRAP transporter large permease subunit [unclassified Salinibacterium]QEE60341.1 TRAP transporter large permease subunit [Salinibacterium sp. dk2585]TXK55414.1 TRAP transporter large permease subunit [Salinibacterium sp. dk5596]
MSAELIVVIVLALFFLMLAIEVPVAFALGFSGIIGAVMLHSFRVADSVLANVPYESTAKFSLIVIPLYIMLGAMATQARIPERVYTVINRVAGRFKGGLAIATIGASGGFAAVSGSSVATAATLGKISVHQMIRHGYSAQLATGIVAIGATLGILIPPSIIMIMYSIMSGESIGQLFSAGIIPGILSAVAYVITALILVKREGSKVTDNAEVLERIGVAEAGEPVIAGRPATTRTARGSELVESKSSSLFAEMRSLVWLLIIIGVVVLSIFTGLTTLSESAAVAALVATIAVIAEHFRSGLRSVVARIRDGLAEAASVTSMAFAVVVGAGIFAYFLVSARVPNNLSRFLSELDVPPMLIVVLILLLMVPLGMFLDSLAVVVIVVPIVYPTIVGLGFDGVWFAILLVKMIEIGLLTPPVGMNCFVISGVTGIKLETVFKGVAPFLLCEAVIVGILLAFPDIVLWLPEIVAASR